MIVRMILLMAMPLMFWACSGDDPAPTDPVNPDAAATAPAVPDTPGDATAATPPPSEPVPASPAPSVEPTPAETPPTTTAMDSTGDMVVKPSHLNVRKGPGIKNPVVRVLKAGTTVSTQGCKNGWCKIGDGEYVSKKYLTEKKG